MLPSRNVVWPFVLRFTCILAVYLIPFRPIGTAYGALAAGVGNLMLGDAPHAGAALHFARPDPDEHATDATPDAFGVELLAEKPETGSRLKVPIDLRTLAYLPTAVFVALAIASPIWERARGAVILVAGLVALQAFLLLSIAAPLLLFFADPVPMHLVELGSASRVILNVFYRTLVAPPGMAFAVPGFLWLVLMWVVPARPATAA
jgi:hypothetical protein